MSHEKEKLLAEMFNGVTPDQVWMVGDAIDYCYFMQRNAVVTEEELEQYFALARSGEADRYLADWSRKMRIDNLSRARLRKPQWRDSLVQRVMDSYDMSEEQAVQAIIDFGG